MLNSVWTSRNLLASLVRRDLTVRYKSTVLGFFWSFAKPLAFMAIYQVIFGEILQLKMRETRIPYSLHILAAVLPWTFLTSAASEAMGSVLASANLVKKVRLPVEVFPLSAAIAQAIHFGLAMCVFVAVMIVVGLPPGPAILFLPFIAAIQFILVVAVSLLLSALYVYYRDVASIWEVISAAWFYACPIIYPVYYALDYFQKRQWAWAEWCYLANPMTPLVLGYRRVLLYGSVREPLTEFPSDWKLALAIAGVGLFSVGLLWCSSRIFRRLSGRFADIL